VWRIGLWSNPWVWLGSGVMLAAQAAFTYLPVMNRLFHTSPIGWIWWVYFPLAGSAVFAVVETYKLVARRRARRAFARSGVRD
jgi:cation-transporting P-type ATPase F